MRSALTADALEVMFRSARTHRSWTSEPVSTETLHALYELVKWGPTTNNTCPARFLFIVSSDAKQRLKPHLSVGNVEQTMAAPATVIIGFDLAFFELMPKLSPNPGARDSWARRSPAELREAAFRNGSLQAGYFIVAARALGLDCGPMSGFDNEGVDGEFFSDTSMKSNLLCNIGYGDGVSVRPRSGRLNFDEACRIV